MKKLTLTFCALFALFVLAPAYADGPERASSKEKEVLQPAPPVCDFYRAHEWDLDIWGAYAFAADTGRYDVPNDDPFTGDFIYPGGPEVDFGTYAYGNTLSQPQSTNPDERLNIGQVSKNELFARDNTWGGGVDVKYFWSRYFGVGVEGVGLAAKTNFAGGGLLTFTGRFPFGRFAPYLTGGLGFVDGGATLYKFFKEEHTYDAGNVLHEQESWHVDPVSNHHVRGLGQIGAGLEFRVTCHVGLMTDFTWNFVFGQDNHADKIDTFVQQGTVTDVGYGFADTVINTADYLKPGHGSDHQDFGMVRFGVTFSY